MKFIVCIKQVPEVSDVKFDPVTRTIIREGVPNIVSPFDRRGLAEAIRLRDLYGGEVVVITMGPPQARDALVECLGAGADRAIHLLDKAFAGSDTLATSRALALALRNEDYDVIFCGKYSVDAETGQVGPELAELLNIPQVTGATKLEFGEDKKTVIVERETDDGFETIECDLPVLLTAAERLVRPIKVKEPQIEAGRAKPIKEISAVELSSDTSIFGLAGSPTWVTEIRSVARSRQIEMIEGATVKEKAARLIERLDARGVFKSNGGAKEINAMPESFERAGTDNQLAGEVWVVAELIEDHLRKASYELLGKASEIARKLNANLCALVAGADVAWPVKVLAAHGAERVYFAEGGEVARYSTALFTSLLVEAIRTYNPLVVLLPSTSNGRDLAPRVAARLEVGLTADCIDLDVNERGELVQYKPAFGGNIVALILSRLLPQMATVKPGVLRAPVPVKDRLPVLTRLDIPRIEDRRARLIDARREVSAEVVELDEAKRVVCVGTGVGGAENLNVIESFARALGASIGATRRVVDQGLFPRHYQIGLTGKVISPRLYVGVGVRGALNHTIGIQQAETVVAINNDPAAEIFHTADFGVVEDWAEFVPALTEKLESMFPKCWSS